MIRSVFLAVLLAGCAGAPEAALQPLEASLSCDADTARTGADGASMTLYISLYVPASLEGGRFCLQTGCEDARFMPIAGAPGWNADMYVGAERRGGIHIAPDRQSFTLSLPHDETGLHWAGTCAPAAS